MNGGVTIRLALPSDAARLARAHVDSWNAAYQGLIPDSFLQARTYQKREEAWAGMLAGGVGETHLAEDGDCAAAILTIGVCRDADVDAGRTGEIWGIYVAPDYWRQGIGTMLVREAERLLQSRGSDEVVLWVLEGNLAAREFYQAMGYRPDGATKTLTLGKPLQAVRYRRALVPQASAP